MLLPFLAKVWAFFVNWKFTDYRIAVLNILAESGRGKIRLDMLYDVQQDAGMTVDNVYI